MIDTIHSILNTSSHICTTLILLCILYIFKALNTYRNISIILNAIYKYNNHTPNYNNNKYIPYEVVKPYKKIFWNIFNWRCKNTVSHDIYEKLKPFITISYKHWPNIFTLIITLTYTTVVPIIIHIVTHVQNSLLIPIKYNKTNYIPQKKVDKNDFWIT